MPLDIERLGAMLASRGGAPPPSGNLSMAPPSTPNTFGAPVSGVGAVRGPLLPGKTPSTVGNVGTFGGATTASGISGATKGGAGTSAGGTKPIPSANRPTGGGTQKPSGKPAQKPAGPLYGGYTPEQLLANPALEAKLDPKNAGRKWAADKAKYQKPPAATPTPSTPPQTPTVDPPAPGGPSTPSPGSPTTPGPGAPGGGGNPPTTPGSWGGSFIDPWAAFYGTAPQPYAFDDFYNAALSAIPVMDLNRKRNIAGAMTDAGARGTRWGSAAARKAGEIGAESAMQENALLNQMLYGAAEQDKNRALTATGQGITMGGVLDSIRSNQLGALLGAGQMEQGRADDFSRTRFDDWSQNRLGYLPMLLQAAMSRGAGSPGQIYSTQTPGKPSTIEQYGPILQGLLGAFA